MKKLVIFDLDGTLFDTTGAMTACGNYALERLGLPLLPPAAYARVSGGSVEAFVCAVLDAAGDTEHCHYDEFWRLYLEKNGNLTEEANVPYDGIRQVLTELRERGVLLTVLSNKDQESCVPIVEHAFGKETFHRICGGRKDVPPKPDATAVFALMEEFGVTARECLYIGDTEIDMQTGKNAGLDTVAALWGYRTQQVLEPFQPAYLLREPRQILSLFAESSTVIDK